MKKWIPLSITLLLAAWVLSTLRGPQNAADGLPVKEFGQLPVVKDGRHQPMDSMARNSLLILRKKQTVNFEPWKGNFDKPKIVSATEWMMELMMDHAAADERPCFRIDNADVKNLLHVPMDAGEAGKTDGKHYSWNQIAGHLDTLKAETQRASQVKQELRNAYERSLLDLWEATNVYRSLKFAMGPANAGDLKAGLAEFRSKLSASREAFQAQMDGQPHDTAALEWAQAQLSTPLVVPAHDGQKVWSNALQEVASLKEDAPPHFSIAAYAEMTAAWKAKDMPAMTRAIAGYREKLTATGSYTKDLSKGKAEQLFNHVEPFYRGMVVSLLAFLFAVLVWVNPLRFEWSRKTAMGLMTLTFVLLTAGLIWRMVLEGRPPLTNLYSSALFIGWAAVGLGLLLELFWPSSIGIAVSSLLAFGTLIIAHFLSLDGDTMIMLRAVLDTNFWLATHVVIVTLGYAATYVAGIIGVIYVVRAVFTPHVTKEMQKGFSSMAFAIICFATLFSFVGTVLGGIWADQSWGRFWGWDPKENGALIIVLWNALILHARLGGLVRDRGLLVLSIGGNIVTSWSWFGTNMLGIGLHSYGFMDSAFYALLGFVGLNGILIILGCLPQQTWRSFNRVPDPLPPSGGTTEAAAG